MYKVRPNPPNDPNLTLDQSHSPSSSLFSVADDASSETLIANSYETFSSVTALLLDLSDELTGKQRDVALAIHQLSELGVLLVDKLMARESASTVS
ncbi:DUF6124 family protein [Pseudomonas sp. AM4(2022)]|uniref:DUF6124 family protein n=1 Tax=Pseudomonas sp. AM4(2022) TaxID=2983408 RepID=UPI002E821CFE|nr:DUF6124 family protein [Pseudomonas sp. AM4(2022)]